MASGKAALCLGLCISAWIIAADAAGPPKAENVRWVSVDFKTTLHWDSPSPDHTYSVYYSRDGGDWLESPDCIQVPGPDCDLTNQLIPYDWKYTADIKTDSEVDDYDYPSEEMPHTFSDEFNPYRESAISAVEFTVEDVGGGKVIINISDPLTGIHQRGRQLTIRDILKKDLHYKITYNKAGTTGKRELTRDTSVAEVTGLDVGQSYCFIVAAFIPSRPKKSQHGSWGLQQCTPGDPNLLLELNVGALIGGIVVLLVLLAIIAAVTVICCRRRKNKGSRTLQQTQQSSTVV